MTVYINGVAQAAVGAATKEFFVPVTYASELSTDARHSGGKMTISGSYAHVEFFAPNDFTTITEAVMVMVAMETATHRHSFYATYGAQGEDKDVNSESDLDNDVAETDELIYEFDVSGILSSLAAGDYVGILQGSSGTNTAIDLVIGFRLKYS